MTVRPSKPSPRRVALAAGYVPAARAPRPITPRARWLGGGSFTPCAPESSLLEAGFVAVDQPVGRGLMSFAPVCSTFNLSPNFQQPEVPLRPGAEWGPRLGVHPSDGRVAAGLLSSPEGNTVFRPEANCLPDPQSHSRPNPSIDL